MFHATAAVRLRGGNVLHAKTAVQRIAHRPLRSLACVPQGDWVICQCVGFRNRLHPRHNADRCFDGDRAEQAEQHRKVICPDCSKWDFYAALNMVYSDYAAVAKKMGVDRPEYYAHMAKAFLCDEDAEDGKLVKYKEYIAG